MILKLEKFNLVFLSLLLPVLKVSMLIFGYIFHLRFCMYGRILIEDLISCSVIYFKYLLYFPS